MSRFASGAGKEDKGGVAPVRQLAFAGEPGGGPAFGKRKERPEAEMPRILNPAPSGASLRTPRSVSPPLAD